MDRKAFTLLHRSVSRLLLNTVPAKDPWERVPYEVPLHVYGSGARRAFRWYFRGESTVRVASLDEMKHWLLDCRYSRDVELFQAKDHWQHPCTFEYLRQGDCEDFALWTWRKLVRLGYQAEFVAGRCQGAGGPPADHAWVLFEQDGGPHVFDPVVRAPRRMIRTLEDARADYVPEVSVDGRFQRFVYGGYFERLRARQPQAAPVWPFRRAAPAPQNAQAPSLVTAPS